MNSTSFCCPVGTRQVRLGGPPWNSSTRDLEAGNSIKAAPRDRQGPPPASPRGPEVLCSPALVENELVNATGINQQASLCDTFTQIGCNWLNGIPSKSRPDLLPHALPARRGELELMTSRRQLAHVYTVRRHSVRIIWRLENLPLASLGSQGLENRMRDA